MESECTQSWMALWKQGQVAPEKLYADFATAVEEILKEDNGLS